MSSSLLLKALVPLALIAAVLCLIVIGPLVARKERVVRGVEPMDNDRLGRLLEERIVNLNGQPGSWNASVDDSTIIILTDERANRMRIMMPVMELEDQGQQELLVRLLEANFDSALDAKYALRDGVVWSVFLHPLSTLTEADLDSGLAQVRRLRATTGTSFSSSDLHFRGGDPADPQDNGKPEA